MWYEGFLGLSPWSLVAVTLLMTHVTIIGVTVYLHRYSAHRSLELNAGLKHFFRFWLWLTTAQNTREWTAIHRKHHAKCETVDDPHSPVIKGLSTVLRKGAELYRAEAENPETLRIYGKNCPDDWIERNLYSRFPLLGVAIMGVIDLLLFGTIGITIWAIQMMWIPVWAAGVVNGLGHAVGYRNFECRDAATNLVPWGILIGGEELHNNHHTYPNSAKLSVKKWEFDLGWAWITGLQLPPSGQGPAGRADCPPRRRQGQPGHGHRHGDPQQPLPDHGPVPQAGDRRRWSSKSWKRSITRSATSSTAPSACCRGKPACWMTNTTFASRPCSSTARR